MADLVLLLNQLLRATSYVFANVPSVIRRPCSVGFRLPHEWRGKVCALCALCAIRALMVGMDGLRDFGPGKSDKKCARRAVSAISHRCWFRWRQPVTTVFSPCWSRCRNVRAKRTKSGKRAGPAIGDSVVRKICAISVVCVVRGCVSMLVSLLRSCRSHVLLKKSALKALKVVLSRANMPVFPRSRRLCYKISPGKNIALRLEPASTGDKRDDMSAYTLRISDCPVCHRASVVLWPRLAWAFRWCGVS